MQPTLPPSSMENRREKHASGESFSFPSTPNQDSDFEFGCVTPDSPSGDPCKTSPADHLFSNGRLLPHSFPPHHQPPVSRTTSRTSSTGGKDSLMSSRSNSTNSRSSSCSSARTSSSDSSERRLFYSRVAGKSPAAAAARDRYQMASAQTYGCSQRWQYITPVPAALSRDASRRRRSEQMKKEEAAKTAEKKKRAAADSRRFGWRFLRWFVMACKECHAMEPGCQDEKVLRESVKIR